MTEERDRQAGLLEDLLCRQDALGEPGDRHADVRDIGNRPLAEGKRCVVSIMPGLPELVPLLRIRGPLEIASAVLLDKLANSFSLFHDVVLGAMKFHQQGWFFR